MQTILKWEKPLFSNSYNIYSKGQQIGFLKNKSFSDTVNAELNNKKYKFNTKGFFNKHTEIIDVIENKVIGEITYHNWNSKAKILIENIIIDWEYENFWKSKWRLLISEKVIAKYTSTNSSGQINSIVEDEIYLLSGLFVKNYYLKSAIAVFIIIITIVVSNQ